MAKFAPFRCPTCHAFGVEPCVVGRVGSDIWKEKRPLSRWHASRLKMYKTFIALLQRNR